MNPFYKQPLPLLWIEAILLLVLGFYPAILIIEAAYEQPFLYLLFVAYLPLGQFCFTPFLKLVGVYKYYSPMLLGYNANSKQIDIHSGGSFDYLFVMRRYKAGITFRNVLLVYYLEGLLNIIEQIETGQIPPTVSITGTSYFFNERTMAKLGFTMAAPSALYKINILANFIDLTWMYSVTKGAFAIPKIWQVKKAEISGENLRANKSLLAALHSNLQARVKVGA